MSDSENEPEPEPDLKTWLESKKLGKLLVVLNENEIEELSNFAELEMETKKDVEVFVDELGLKLLQKKRLIKAIVELTQVGKAFPVQIPVQVPVQVPVIPVSVQVPVVQNNNNYNSKTGSVCQPPELGSDEEDEEDNDTKEEEEENKAIALLKQWNFGQYISNFIGEGYDDVDSWDDLTLHELKQELKMKSGHAKQFLKKIKTIKTLGQSTSSVVFHQTQNRNQTPGRVSYPSNNNNNNSVNSGTDEGREGKYNELDTNVTDMGRGARVPSPAPPAFESSDAKANREREERRAKNAHLRGDKNYVPVLQSKNDYRPSKTIMVIGATGTGKTTLLNSMMNFLYEVEFNDPYRFKLIQEISKKDGQAESQTDIVTPYLLSPPALDYDLTVIDTPGFGDSRGMAQDKKITQNIRNCFETQISTIDAICFVIRAPQARLTATQRYIFSQVLGIFGADIEDNIFILLTFADQKKPPAIAALKAGNIPFVKFFKLNNSAFDLPDEEEDDEDATGNDFAQMFWVMGMSAFKKLFSELNKVEKKSLTMTKQVLKRRQQLEVYIQGINPVINEGFDILGSIRAQILIIDKCSAEVDANENFTMSVPKTRRIKKPITGHYTTICESCQWTCHLNCGIPDDGGKMYCAAMTDGYCHVCPNSCHWPKHSNKSYVWEAQKYFVEQDVAELKAKYFDSKSKVSASDQIIDGMTGDLEKIENKLNLMIANVRLCLNELSDIALRPNVMTQEDYIEKLIVAEEDSKQVGWQGRVAALRKMMQSNQMMTAIQGKKYDPFANFKDVQKHMKRKSKNSNKSQIVKKKKSWFFF